MREIDWAKVWARMLVFSIPLMIICISTNLVARSSDAYTYDLKSTQAVKQAVKIIDEKKLSKLMGDFMLHKTDELKLMEEVKYKPENVFKKGEEDLMKSIRKVLDVMLIVGIIMGLLTAVVYYLMHRWRKRELHMTWFKRGTVVLGALTLLNAFFVVNDSLRKIAWGRLPGGEESRTGFLAELFGESLFFYFTTFQVLLSCIMMGLLFYITWNISGRRKLFKGF